MQRRVILSGLILALSLLFPTLATAQNNILTMGQTVSDAVTDNAGDIWTFYGEAGDVTTLQMQATGGTLNPLLQILDYNGNILVSNDDYQGQNAAIVGYVLPYTGYYRIQALGNGGTTGNYTLSAYDGIPTNLASPNRCLLAYGTTVQGHLTPAAPSEIWSLSGNAGDVVTITMRAQETGLNPYLTLTSPGGGLLLLDDNGGGGVDAQITTILPTTGIYQVTASSALQSSFGAYALSAQANVITQNPNIISGGLIPTRLGGFQVEWYCNQRGYGIEIVNNNADWACQNDDTGQIVFTLGQADFNTICRTTYGLNGAFAVRDQNNAFPAYNWSCYAFGNVRPAAQQPQTPAPTQQRVSPRYGVEVNVRSGPGLNYEILQVIDWRESYPLIGQTDTWYIISVNGRQGYVSKRWSEIETD